MWCGPFFPYPTESTTTSFLTRACLWVPAHPLPKPDHLPQISWLLLIPLLSSSFISLMSYHFNLCHFSLWHCRGTLSGGKVEMRCSNGASPGLAALTEACFIFGNNNLARSGRIPLSLPLWWAFPKVVPGCHPEESPGPSGDLSGIFVSGSERG